MLFWMRTFLELRHKGGLYLKAQLDGGMSIIPSLYKYELSDNSLKTTTKNNNTRPPFWLPTSPCPLDGFRNFKEDA